MICWLSQLLRFHYSLRNVPSTHLIFIIFLALCLHEISQTGISGKDRKITNKRKNMYVFLQCDLAIRVILCYHPEPYRNAPLSFRALQTSTRPVLGPLNVQIPCIFGFSFILLIKSPFQSWVKRTIFQSILTILLCNYWVTNSHTIWFWNGLELKVLTPNLMTITVLGCFRSTGYFNYVPFELRAKVTNFVFSLCVVNIRTYGLFSAASLRLRTLKLWTTSLGNVQAFYRFK